MSIDGMTIPAWGGRRAQKALLTVKQIGRTRNATCCLCGEPIDYGLKHPHPKSCTVQHVVSRRVRPDLTWEPSNWAPAHLVCNQSDGDGTRRLDIGVAVY